MENESGLYWSGESRLRLGSKLYGAQAKERKYNGEETRRVKTQKENMDNVCGLAILNVDRMSSRRHICTFSSYHFSINQSSFSISRLLIPHCSLPLSHSSLFPSIVHSPWAPDQGEAICSSNPSLIPAQSS